MIEAIEYATAGQLAERKNFIEIRRRIAARAVPDYGIDLKRRAWPVTPEPAPVAEPATVPIEQIQQTYLVEDLVTVVPDATFTASNFRMLAIIKRVVCKHFSITPCEIISPFRSHRFCLPRHISWYLARHFTTMSYPQIAHRFGNRNHSTLVKSVKSLKKRMISDRRLCKTVCELQTKLEFDLLA